MAIIIKIKINSKENIVHTYLQRSNFQPSRKWMKVEVMMLSQVCHGITKGTLSRGNGTVGWDGSNVDHRGINVVKGHIAQA